MLFALMNCFVHVFMYAYYLVANIRPDYTNNTWWKKYITQLQMVTTGHITPLSILDIPSQGHRGPGSSVGIATGYGLDGPRIDPGGGKIFHTCPHRPWGPPSLLYNRYRVFPEGKKRPGRDADPSPPSSAVVKKG